MSEIDDLKNDAEKYVQDHPQQVKEGEQDLEKKLAPGAVQGGQPAQSGQEGQAQPAGSQPPGDAADRDSAAGDSAGSQ
ncbi:MAG: hypothetical protein WAK71_15035 [Streptosporangiaceae bacterium]